MFSVAVERHCVVDESYDDVTHGWCHRRQRRRRRRRACDEDNVENQKKKRFSHFCDELEKLEKNFQRKLFFAKMLFLRSSQKFLFSHFR